MPTFQRCDSSVSEMADAILRRFETHAPLREAKVRIDYVFAFCDRDDTTGARTNHALSKNGVQALGICKKVSLKDRVLGRGDAEISLDGDWWQDANEDERAALLDHELHHLVATGDTDDFRRPILKLRKHDFEFGWFKVIAARHGVASQERIQAARMMDDAGQYFWPGLTGARAEVGRINNLELVH